MGDWSKYAEPASNKWDQYAEKGGAAKAQPGGGEGQGGVAQLLMNMAVPGVMTGGIAPNNMPATLQGLGQMAPGALSIPLGTAGRTAGEALRQGFGTLVGQQPDLKAIGQAAKAGALQSTVGYGLGKVLGLAGTPFNNRAGQELTGRVEGVLQKAGEKGKAIPVSEVLDSPAMRGLERQAKVGGQAMKRQFDAFVENLMNKQGPSGAQMVEDLTPSDAHLLKQVADAKAAPIRLAESKGGYVPPGDKFEAQMWKAVADKGRQVLRAQIPGYRKLVAEQARNIGVKNAVSFGPGRLAAKVAGGAAAGSLIPNDVLPGPHWVKYAAGAGLGPLLVNPQALNILSIILKSHLGQSGLQQLGAGGTAALTPGNNSQ